MSPVEKLLLDAKDIQALTGWGLSKVRSLLRSGSIPCLRNGRHVRVPRTHLEQWITQEVERTNQRAHQIKEVARQVVEGRGKTPKVRKG